MTDAVSRFLNAHLARRLASAGVAATPADLARLISFEPVPMPNGPTQAVGPDTQTLARVELGFRRGDVTVELNARDGAPVSWMFPQLAEGDSPPPDPAAALAAATTAAAPPPDAVLGSAALETIGGAPVFVAAWEHHHQGVLVERDHIRALVSGRSGQVFAVSRHWHVVDFTPTER